MNRDRIKQIMESEVVRYIIAGGLTTAVNLIVFSILRYLFHVGLTTSNFISIFAAIVFAFFVNKFFAFRAKDARVIQIVTEFLKFVGGRLVTMIIEVGGVAIFVNWMGINDFVSKLITQFVVVVCNYIISKLFVFNNKNTRTISDWLSENWQYVVSFLIPFVLFIIVCIKQKVTPFGGNTLMIVDSLHQYLPFFSEYYDKLTKSGEFLYSWNGAMGYNFLTLWAYYLSSPFNLLILLFDKMHINIAMTLIIGLKICLSSVTMTYMLTKMSGKKDGNAIMFGVCYAFSNYVIGYYWNIMWLDVLLLTPLVVLGLHKLIDDKDARLYIVTLFMALFCNFYISFMLCIFLVLWFLIYPHKSIKAFLISGVRFGLSSILAAAMAAFVLIPTYTGIMLTGPADSEFPAFSWYGKWIDILKKFCFYSGSITNQGDDGGVNLYCGILVLVLVILYFCIKAIPWQQKIKRGLLLVFFVVSFNNQWFNYVWHGFHDQFGIPNRFSFLMIFAMLIMAYEVLENIETISFWTYWIPMFILTGIVIYNNEVNALFDDEKVIRLTMVLWIGYFMAFMLRIILEWQKETLTIVLSVIVVAELGFNALFSFEGNGQVGIDGYFSTSKSMWKAAESVKDGSFYREELSRNHLVDENFWLNLKSVGIFGSTANGDAVDLLNHMGFYTAANEHLYNGATPITDALFGVKYLYKRSDDYLTHGFDYLKTVDGTVDIYKNPNALSLGYMVSDNIWDWEYDQYEAALALNDFVTKATGINDALFTPMKDIYTGSGENCEVTYNELGEGTYAYSRTESGDLAVSLNWTAQDDLPVYVRATGTDLAGIQVYINGDLQCDGRYFFQLLPIGETHKGDQIQVRYTFNGSEADDQTVNLKGYTFDEDVFERFVSKLKEQQLDVTSYDSNTIEGTIDVKEDGMMMTSIIDEPGWRVYVDGKRTEYDEIGDSFLGVSLEKGKHTIKITFIPASLPYAAALSIVAWALFIVYIKYRIPLSEKWQLRIEARKRKKEEEMQEEKEQEETPKEEDPKEV